MSSGSSILQKPLPAAGGAGHSTAMTGVGQRMPSQAQQAIILRPGQQTGLVTLASGGQRPTAVLVNTSNSPGIRVQAPGIQTSRPATPATRNVLINQSGGSQISVPLSALQSMQAGKFQSCFCSSHEMIRKSIIICRSRHTYRAGRPSTGQD